MSIKPMPVNHATLSTEPISLMLTTDTIRPPLDLAQRFATVRQQTMQLSLPLSEADMTIQADDFVSPGKWHLAHTTWFFEEFFLKQLGDTDHAWVQSADYRFLFNSYYETIGKRQAQGRRGLITRPDLSEVLRYRAAVDAAVIDALQAGVSQPLADIIELGLHHEQQHQELFLTDILYNLAQNPIFPAYQPLPVMTRTTAAQALQQPQAGQMIAFAGGLHSIGHSGQEYGFDNEFPRHKTYLEPYRLASLPVSNGDWIDFIEDGGYRNPLLWLADGWKAVHSEGWSMPLYWQGRDNDDQPSSADRHMHYRCMTLAGLQPVNRHAPVCHISYFEAEAYARWAGKRLPTEAEWEVAASRQLPQGHFAENGLYMPQPAGHEAGHDAGPLRQLYGDVWEWTASPYVAYPGFKASPGAVGEYNGKFMNGQYVLRGGSCVTPAGHIRATYRNFFYPHQRWQFSGLRLAD